MTTDNSLPDVWAVVRNGDDFVERVFPVERVARKWVERLTNTGHGDTYHAARYTPAEAAEATIKSLRDALDALATEVGQADHWLRHTEAYGAALAALAPDCLLAKDAP